MRWAVGCRLNTCHTCGRTGGRACRGCLGACMHAQSPSPHAPGCAPTHLAGPRVALDGAVAACQRHGQRIRLDRGWLPYALLQQAVLHEGKSPRVPRGHGHHRGWAPQGWCEHLRMHAACMSRHGLSVGCQDGTPWSCHHPCMCLGCAPCGVRTCSVYHSCLDGQRFTIGLLQQCRNPHTPGKPPAATPPPTFGN